MVETVCYYYCANVRRGNESKSRLVHHPKREPVFPTSNLPPPSRQQRELREAVLREYTVQCVSRAFYGRALSWKRTSRRIILPSLFCLFYCERCLPPLLPKPAASSSSSSRLDCYVAKTFSSDQVESRRLIWDDRLRRSHDENVTQG